MLFNEPEKTLACKTCHSNLNPYEKYEYCSTECRLVMLRHLKSRVLGKETSRTGTVWSNPSNPNKQAQLYFLKSLLRHEIDKIEQELAWAKNPITVP
jgi:hypothetical protein